MYQIGDYVIYSSSGVCRVEEIGTPKATYVDKTRNYYKLTPLYSTETIYAPVDTKAFMRPVITRDEAERLVMGIPEVQEEAIECKSIQMLSDHYQSNFESHDCNDLVKLIKTVYTKNRKAKDNGKKMGKIDERYLKRAKELLYGELAIALGISMESVSDYISGRLEQPTAQIA